MSNQLTNLDFLDKEAQLYKISKDSIKENGEVIDKAIRKNTKKEFEDVQNAVKVLNEKIDRIMKTDFVKNKETQIKEYHEQMNKSIKVASDTFFKVRDIILTKDISETDKQQYIKKLYNKIIDKFMTKEEKAFFEQLISNNGIIMINGQGLQSRGKLGF
tara:strand:- start:1330 stop:1806 length:477 start_codon:yes stop_codon:yes gene_type:complete